MVNKKGFIFSLISILLVVFFGAVMSVFLIDSQFESDFMFSNSLKSTDLYYRLIKDNYLEISLDISSRAAIESIVNYSITNRDFFNNESEVTNSIASLFNDGSFIIDGNTYDYSSSTMANKTMTHFIDVLKESSKDVIYNSNTFEIIPKYDSLMIYQDSPWDILIRLKFSMRYLSDNFNISDNDGFYVISRVSLINISDPLYGVYSGNNKKIFYDSKTYVNNSWDFIDFNSTLQNQLFVSSTRGMSFIMRLVNSTNVSKSSSLNLRIESFILPELVGLNSSSPLIMFNSSVKKRSFIDHLFFNNIFFNCKDSLDYPEFLYSIDYFSENSLYDDFRLDLNSSVFYLGKNFTEGEIEVVCGGGTIK